MIMGRDFQLNIVRVTILCGEVRLNGVEVQAKGLTITQVDIGVSKRSLEYGRRLIEES